MHLWVLSINKWIGTTIGLLLLSGVDYSTVWVLSKRIGVLHVVATIGTMSGHNYTAAESVSELTIAPTTEPQDNYI